MEALLLKYGYVLLFLGVAVEGEAFLLAAALLAHRGLLSLPVVIGVAIAANSVADQAYYLAARARGRAWLELRYGAHPRYQRVVQAIARHGRWLLLGSRFAFGFRILIPAACGALGMPIRVFTPVNIAAGTLWAVPTALVGYYASAAVATLARELRDYEVTLALLAVLTPAALLGAWRLQRIILRRDLRWSDLHALVPVAMGLMGIVNLLSAVVPRPPASLLAVERWLPLEVMQRSRPLMLFAGIALLQVTRNLARRKELAWWVASGALAVSLVSHLGRAFDFQHSLVAAILLAYLVAFRRRFYARSDPVSLRAGLLMAPVLAGAVIVYGYVGLRHLRHEFTWEPEATPLSEALRAGIATGEGHLDPVTVHAARFLGSVQIAGWIARLYLLVLLLRPVALRGRLEAPPHTVAQLFAAHGRRSLAAFAVQDDKHHHLLCDGRALAAYAVRGEICLACGDPLAADAEFERSVRELDEHCRRNGWTSCIYEAAEDRLAAYRERGARVLKIAEEAIIDLDQFSLAGGKRAALRSMVHKVVRAGLVVRPYRRDLEPDAEIDEQLEEISEEWLAEKRLGELGFTLGRFSLEALDPVHVFLCLDQGRVQAFASWLPYWNGKAAVLDLMRKRRDAVSGTMDLLVAESLRQLKERGLAEASLANAPLANVGEPRGGLDRGVALVFERMNAFYGYKNLFQFKKKFAPRWEGRYLVYPRGADLPRIVYAMTDVHGSGGLLKLLLGR